MSFSSPGFLFGFMPIVFFLYFLLPNRTRNLFLMLSSICFYFVDAGMTSYVLIGSILFNHVLAKYFMSYRSTKVRKLILGAGIVINLVPLIYYKYWNFLTGSLSVAYTSLGQSIGFEPINIILPAGISFFTFQGISYIVDAYRREVEPARTLVDFGMYHSLFPQLIAGPIVRYKEVESEIYTRNITIEDVQWGIVLFCIGLGKKIIIADNVGIVADRMFSLSHEQLSIGGAWLGIVAYTLQIFFDFSGYSDMAIGMGRMLGFRFPQNFDQPYRSQSVTEFWRRWHMTLSRWFRDYLYIPLGGNRAGQIRTYVNLAIVFALCGLWHGAAMTFLIWGLWHGFLLVIERILHNKFGWHPSGVLGWAVTMLLVMIGWVFFRAPSLQDGLAYLLTMFGGGASMTDPVALLVITSDKITFMMIGLLLALIPFNFGWLRTGTQLSLRAQVSASIGALLLFVYSASLIATNGFNPFIYFRF